MTSPSRSRAVAELDALTDQLPARVDQLARRLNRVMSTVSPGRLTLDGHGRLTLDGEIVCPLCLAAPCDCLIDRTPAVTR